jgi:hypothetical protein
LDLLLRLFPFFLEIIRVMLKIIPQKINPINTRAKIVGRAGR